MHVISATENKGGTAKSTTMALVSSALFGAGFSIARVDTDTSNSSFKTIYPDAKHLSLSESNIKAGGDLAAAIFDAAEGGADYLLLDTGARDEARFIAYLPQIIEATSQTGGRVAVVRPITLNLQVHNNALRFCKEFALDGSVSVILMPIVACGRALADFDLLWNDLKSVQKFLELPNVVQMYVEDLGALYAENMPLARAPLRDIAAQRFNIAENAPQVIRERLQTVYNRGARLHIAQWLKVHETRFLDALTKVGGLKQRKTTA